MILRATDLFKSVVHCVRNQLRNHLHNHSHNQYLENNLESVAQQNRMKLAIANK